MPIFIQFLSLLRLHTPAARSDSLSRFQKLTDLLFDRSLNRSLLQSLPDSLSVVFRSEKRDPSREAERNTWLSASHALIDIQTTDVHARQFEVFYLSLGAQQISIV